jgi:hypothetical protein
MPTEKQNVPGRMPERSEVVEGHQDLKSVPPNNAELSVEGEALRSEQKPPKPKPQTPDKRQRT